jgi:hypothetical protein
MLMFATAAWAQPTTVEQIMARVAENQSRGLGQRKDWIYHQDQQLRFRRGNGKLAREEHREYAVAPDMKGFKKELTGFQGKYEANGQYVSYDKPGHTYKEMDIDGELIDEMSDEMINDNSRDGIGNNLFPLTAKEQERYKFKLIGSENYRGRGVYRVAFEPKRHEHFEENNTLWKGEILIDVEEFQPVLISTKLASRIPMAVKLLLGTNIKGLGFSLAYRKFDKDVWFPVSYGGEFQVRAVFFYRRNISISMVNDDFRRTEVSSQVAYATEEK